MTAARMPPTSSACTPAMVVPPGLVTRLCGQLRGHRPSEACAHASVGESLDELEDVRGARAGEAGDGVEVGLLHLERRAQCPEHRADDGRVRIRAGGVGGVGSRELADEARGVGHHAHHAIRAVEPAGEGGERDAGCDRDDDRLARLARAALHNIATHLLHHLWLDGDDEKVGESRNLHVRGDPTHAELLGQRIDARLVGVRGCDVLGRARARLD
mmetsp:Transcript_34203/g.73053  ORF Transcript_34203/g.73053 Transcript_34203/m.73053 type:complete len:215 (-) Transcript_34203:96-740(-)